MVDNNDSDMHLSVVEMEQQLRESGFLDPTLGVREERGLRDPMLTILFDPAKEVTMDDGETVTVIDSLLMTAHTEMQRAYGDIYNNFDMIQNTMETLIHSRDTYAKLMVFLCLLAIDEVLDVVVVAMCFCQLTCARARVYKTSCSSCIPWTGAPRHVGCPSSLPPSKLRWTKRLTRPISTCRALVATMSTC